MPKSSLLVLYMKGVDLFTTEGYAGTESDRDLSDNEADLAKGHVLQRNTMWRIWYRHTTQDTKWFLGAAALAVKKTGRYIRWVKGSFLYAAKERTMSLDDYQSKGGVTMCEWDPNAVINLESPWRQDMKRKATAQQRMLHIRNANNANAIQVRSLNTVGGIA